MEESKRLNGDSSSRDMESKPSRTHLYLSVFILNGLYLICGTTFAWSSPVLEKLKLEASVGGSVASMLSLGSVFGAVLSGFVLDPLGRRGTVTLSMAFLSVSYVLLTLDTSVVQLSIGRFIAGVTSGIVFSSVPLYIAEISEDEVRGLLNTLSQISCCLGSLVVYSMGPFVSYATLHYSMLALCCLFFLMFPLLPQSPYTLIMKKDVEGARQTLAWLRQGRSAAAVEKEVQLVQEIIKQNKTDNAAFTDLFTVPGNRKALTLCSVLLILQQVSGISIIFFYAQTIFRLTGTTIESSTCSIIIGVIMTGSALFCPIAVGYLGYKKPLLASSAGMAMGMVCYSSLPSGQSMFNSLTLKSWNIDCPEEFNSARSFLEDQDSLDSNIGSSSGGLGVFFMLKDNGIDVDLISFMPLLSIVTYIVFFNLGFCNIPWALSGELFPSNIKAKATTFVATTCGLLAFFSTNLFNDLVHFLGLDTLFMLCSFFCCIGVIFITLVVQDTSGLSFVEIQQILNNRKRKDILVDRVKSDIDGCKL